MGSKVCLRCDFENQNFQGTPMEACPNCDVIYEKYELKLKQEPDGGASELARRKADEEASILAQRKANEEALELARRKANEEDWKLYVETLEEKRKITAARRKAQYEKLRRAPLIAKIFYVLAVLSVLGGLILAYAFHPGEPPRGHVWPFEAYFLTGFSLAVGFVQAALYAAIGSGLSYLDEISQNTAKLLEKGN